MISQNNYKYLLRLFFPFQSYMLKLIIGIILLFVVLLSAHFVFVEGEERLTLENLMIQENFLGGSGSDRYDPLVGGAAGGRGSDRYDSFSRWSSRWVVVLIVMIL